MSEARKRALADPEVRARMSEASKRAWAEKLSWCPPELIDDYRLLARHLGAAEARAAIERQLEHETLIAVCPTCDKSIDSPACRNCTRFGCPMALEPA
jgi:hypothetical protein